MLQKRECRALDAALLWRSFYGRSYARHALVQVRFHFVFPQPNNEPTGIFQLAIHAPVTLSILTNFVLPKVCI